VAAFYSAFARLWELAIGGGLAYLVLFHPDFSSLRARVAAYCAAVGLLLICASAVLFSTESAFPGCKVLLPTIGTVLLIWAGPGTWTNDKILSNSILMFTGLI